MASQLIKYGGESPPGGKWVKTASYAYGSAALEYSSETMKSCVLFYIYYVASYVSASEKVIFFIILKLREYVLNTLTIKYFM